MMPLGMGADPSGEEQQKEALHEFEGFVECPLFSGECKISIEKDGLSITSLFQQLPVHYGEISAMEWRNYQVALKTAAGEIIISTESLLSRSRNCFLCLRQSSRTLLFIVSSILTRSRICSSSSSGMVNTGNPDSKNVRVPFFSAQ